MAIALPVEGFMKLETETENGKELYELCREYWDEDFDVNPRIGEGSEEVYSACLRFITPPILSGILEEILGERDETSS